MTDKQLRGLCRAITSALAAATIGRWIDAALPFEGGPHTVAVLIVGALLAFVILGAISEPAGATATPEGTVGVTNVNNATHIVEVSHDA